MSGSSTPIGPLLRTVFESILEVFVLCLAGYILARKGVLDRKTQKQINRLNVSLFTPSLLFSKVAFFLSPAKLRELWIIPIFFVVTTVVSMTVAFVLGWIFRLKRSQRSFAIAAAMFMNSNSLPIALMQSLVVTVPSLKWGEDDNKNAMVGRALTYLVLYSTLGMVLRWSYGVKLLSQADPEPPVDEIRLPIEEPVLDGEEPAFTPSREEYGVFHRNTSGESATAASANPSIVVDNVDVSEDADPKFFYSFPNTPMRRSLQPLPSSEVHSVHTSEDEEEDDVLEFPARHNVTEPTSTIWQSRRRRLRRKVAKVFRNFYEFMTVPLWAALLSLIVACIPPVQHALDNHVQPIKGALTQAGNCSIPLTLVVLGAYFYTPRDAEAERSHTSLPSHSAHLPHTHGASQSRRNRGRSISTSWSHNSLIDNVREMFKLKKRSPSEESSLMKKKAKEKRPGETKTVVIAILSRMVITPLLLLPLMAISTRFDWQEVFEDPVFVVSNVLLIASPPALTLAQITQAASGDAFERLISRTVFWSYCVLTPPSTILVVVVGLILSKL